MNGKINTDLKSLTFIFNRNKPYLLPASIILIGIILFFQFVVPQFKAMLAAKKEVAELSLRIGQLKKNLNTLANINENSLDYQLGISSTALPTNKDFGGVLSALSDTSKRSGVDLGAFSIQIGDLSGSKSDNELSTISLSIPINADIAAVNRFIEVLENTVPLADVDFVKMGDKISTVNILFYYKPAESFNDENISADVISQKELSLIDKLAVFGSMPSF